MGKNGWCHRLKVHIMYSLWLKQKILKSWNLDKFRTGFKFETFEIIAKFRPSGRMLCYNKWQSFGVYSGLIKYFQFDVLWVWWRLTCPIISHTLHHHLIYKLHAPIYHMLDQHMPLFSSQSIQQGALFLLTHIKIPAGYYMMSPLSLHKHYSRSHFKSYNHPFFFFFLEILDKHLLCLSNCLRHNLNQFYSLFSKYELLFFTLWNISLLKCSDSEQPYLHSGPLSLYLIPANQTALAVQLAFCLFLYRVL